MRRLRLCCAIAAFTVAAPAFAAAPEPATQAAEIAEIKALRNAADPLPVRSATVAAASTPCTGTITGSAATSTASGGSTAYPACTASFSAGVGKLGPFKPQLGAPVRLITTGTWTGSLYVGTSVDGCVTVNRLTIGDQAQPDFAGNVNDWIDVPPSSGGVAYCLVATIASGTLSAAVRN